MTTHVRIIKLINGDDIVCSLPNDQLSDKSPLLRIVKPLQIKYVSQLTAIGLKDYIALIKWTAYTNDQIITIPKDKIVTITTATDELIKSYTDVAKKYENISIPKRDNYEIEELSKEENDKFNELWDTFRDTKKILH
jgi:dissimilatory sulfite reductase (desulfoviridin) alpha/beta subunit